MVFRFLLGSFKLRPQGWGKGWHVCMCGGALSTKLGRGGVYVVGCRGTVLAKEHQVHAHHAARGPKEPKEA